MAMTKDEGKYLYVWMKYSAALKVLLKKTDNENQNLQLFKHEFENSGSKTKADSYVFSFELINGRATKTINTTAVGRDLLTIIDNNTAIKDLLKSRSIKVSMDKSLKLQLEKL